MGVGCNVVCDMGDGATEIQSDITWLPNLAVLAGVELDPSLFTLEPISVRFQNLSLFRAYFSHLTLEDHRLRGRA